jgi:ankyrin repeat protein
VKGHPQVLELLCDKKALFDAPSLLSGETPLLLAARYGRKEAVDVLLRKGAAPDARTRQVPLASGKTYP